MTAGPEPWRLRVDENCCQRSGVCVAIAPGFFDVDASGRGRPVAGTVPPESAVLDAAQSCPVGAISVVELATGRVLAPEPADGDGEQGEPTY